MRKTLATAPTLTDISDKSILKIRDAIMSGNFDLFQFVGELYKSIHPEEFKPMILLAKNNAGFSLLQDAIISGKRHLIL